MFFDRGNLHRTAETTKETDMETASKGDVLKNVLTGKAYQVILMGERMVVLESEDRLSKVLTTVGTLKLNYTKSEGVR